LLVEHELINIITMNNADALMALNRVG